MPTVDGQNKTARAYTVRDFDPVSKRLDLDFVLHGNNGPASAWAARVEVGDSFEISAPHPRGGFPIEPRTEHYLLFGDESALPAIGSILETLPAHARADVFVEVADAGEAQTIRALAEVDLTWLHRNGAGKTISDGLEKAVKAIGRLREDTAIWVAAESSVVKSIRMHALAAWGIDRKRLHAAGYWKRGEADHRDEEGFA